MVLITTLAVMSGFQKEIRDRLLQMAADATVSADGEPMPQQDWEKAKGQYIHVGLYQKLEGQKVFEGHLLDLDDQEIKLEIKIKTRRKQLTIPRKQIASARFAIEF